jgi:hypothetical protein
MHCRDFESATFTDVNRPNSSSQQKGIDLIADVFFSILEENPKTQLICVGPVIDLYGKFAALKLEKMMEKYPGRVCSKPGTAPKFQLLFGFWEVQEYAVRVY